MIRVVDVNKARVKLIFVLFTACLPTIAFGGRRPRCEAQFEIVGKNKSAPERYRYTYSAFNRIESRLKKAGVDLRYGGAVSYWGWKVPHSEGSIFRGMNFGSFSEIRSILKKGMDPQKSGYRRLYLDFDPQSPLEYAFQPDNGFVDEGRIIVLFEFRRAAVKTRESANGYRVTSQPIPASAIQRLYVFDRQGAAEFPFKEMTPERFLSTFKKAR